MRKKSKTKFEKLKKSFSLKMMKGYFVLFILGFCSTLSAINTYSQTTNVTVKLSNAKVENLFSEIEKNSDFVILYKNGITENKTVSVDAKNESICELLNKTLPLLNLSYYISGHQIVIVENKKVYGKEKSQALLFEASGTVTDISGEPLAGVSVIEKGTTNGTMTDAEGNFLLKVKPNSILIISYIGFLNKELKAEADMRITMEERPTELDDVVVVGYGVQKKANLTGSVATVKYDKELENRPITDPSQALTGKITGVYVSQDNGTPGSDASTIRIRGYGTLNNSNPLVLIDGVEGRLAEVNPNDIGSITVLKDAASAAIYGSRAANGVILIETKKAEFNEKTTINYNGYIGLQSLGRKYDVISNSADYMTLWNTALTNSGGDLLFPEDVIDGFRSGSDPYRYPNTNYFDEVYRTSIMTQHNVSASIGSKGSSSYISMAYMNNEGIMKQTSSEKYSLNINTEVKLNNLLKLGARTRIMRKITDRPYDENTRVVYMMANGYPFSTPYLQDGKTYGGTQALYLTGDKAGQPIVDTRNPFPDLYNGNRQYINSFLKGNVYLVITPIKELSIMTQYSGQYNNNNQDRYNELAYCYTDLDLSNRTKPLDYSSTLTVSRVITDEYYGTFFVNANYNKRFNEAHDLSATLGFQQESLTYRKTTAEKTDPAKGELHQIDSGTLNPVNTGNKFLWRMLSYFGRINYAYKGKYLAEANLRADASSRFRKGNRWGYFPSFSAGWRISEELFVKNLNVFDNLKVRASWGRLGNQNIGTSSNADYFPYQPTLTQSYSNSYNFANTFAPGTAIQALVDPDITWETTTSIDIGLDLGFFKNRLLIEADYFDKRTKDIIVQLPLPLLMGDIIPPYENIGKMKNNGAELNIAWEDNSSSSGFSYRIGTNFTFLRNKVIKFRDNSPDQLYLIREGYSYQTLYGYIAEGVYQTDEDAKKHMHSNGYSPTAGDLKYKDVNGDGKLDYRDKQEIGNTIPRLTYGLNGSIAWKGFDLSFLFTGVAGVNGYRQNSWTEPLGISGGTITKKWYNAWTAEKPSTKLPMIKVNDTWNRQESSFWATNMAWFKLKNIQLGYTIPSRITHKISIQNLYVYMNASNVFSIVSKDYEGFDPEGDVFSNGYSTYPLPRVISFGINVTF